MLRVFAAVLIAMPAAAAELRPLGTTLCLTANSSGADQPGPVTVEPCNGRPDQQFSKGRQSTIYADGGRCLQVVATGEQRGGTLVAARCHGGAGQRWALARGGQFVNDSQTCLTAPPKPGEAATSTDCKEEDADQSDQKWALYGQF